MTTTSQPFQGRVVLVTGGSSGIGLATARAFAREGARVVLAGRFDCAFNNAAVLGDSKATAAVRARGAGCRRTPE